MAQVHAQQGGERHSDGDPSAEKGRSTASGLCCPAAAAPCTCTNTTDACLRHGVYRVSLVGLLLHVPCAQQAIAAPATGGSGAVASEPKAKRHAPRAARDTYSQRTKLVVPAAQAAAAATQAAAQAAAAAAQPPVRSKSSLPRRSTVGGLRVSAPSSTASSIGHVLHEALQLAQAKGKPVQGKHKAGTRKHKTQVVGPGTRAPDSSDEEETTAPPPPPLPRAEPPLPPTHPPPPPVTFEGATLLTAAGTFTEQLRLEIARRDEARARLQRERVVQQHARSQAAAARLQLRVNELVTEERQRQRNAAAVLERMEGVWSVMLSNPMRAFGSTCFIQVRL